MVTVMTANMGSYRVVGRVDRDLPEDSIFPLDTPEQRKVYMERLAQMKAMHAKMPPYRLAPGEPRVKRFATLEEADADWTACALRAKQSPQSRQLRQSSQLRQLRHPEASIAAACASASACVYPWPTFPFSVFADSNIMKFSLYRRDHAAS
jgi:hypothetical protein